MIPTQNELILKHLKQCGSITPREAEDLYACMRLASRIHDLKRQGVRIKTESVAFRSRSGRNGAYARYSLEADQ